MPKVIVHEAGLEKIVDVEHLSTRITAQDVLRANVIEVTKSSALQAHMDHFRKAGFTEDQVRQYIEKKLRHQQNESDNRNEVQKQKANEQLDAGSAKDRDVGIKYKADALGSSHVYHGGGGAEIGCPCGANIAVNANSQERKGPIGGILENKLFDKNAQDRTEQPAWKQEENMYARSQNHEDGQTYARHQKKEGMQFYHREKKNREEE